MTYLAGLTIIQQLAYLSYLEGDECRLSSNIQKCPSCRLRTVSFLPVRPEAVWFWH